MDDADDLPAAIELAQRHDPRIIVEQGFVGARELECGVLGDLDEEVGRWRVRSQRSRLHSPSGFYDFEAKYLPEEQVSLDVPADVDRELANQIREVAVRAFEVIGCEGLARVDVFVTRDRQVVIKVNTMPGFTHTRCSRGCGRRAGCPIQSWSNG